MLQNYPSSSPKAKHRSSLVASKIPNLKRFTRQRIILPVSRKPGGNIAVQDLGDLVGHGVHNLLLLLLGQVPIMLAVLEVVHGELHNLGESFGPSMGNQWLDERRSVLEQADGKLLTKLFWAYVPVSDLAVLSNRAVESQGLEVQRVSEEDEGRKCAAVEPTILKNRDVLQERDGGGTQRHQEGEQPVHVCKDERLLPQEIDGLVIDGLARRKDVGREPILVEGHTYHRQISPDTLGVTPVAQVSTMRVARRHMVGELLVPFVVVGVDVGSVWVDEGLFVDLEAQFRGEIPLEGLEDRIVKPSEA